MAGPPTQRDLIGWATVVLAPFAITAFCAVFGAFPVALFESAITGVLVLLCLLAMGASSVMLWLRRRRMAEAGAVAPLPIAYPFALSLAFVAFAVSAYLLLAITGGALLLRLGSVELFARAFGTAAILFLFTFTIGRTWVTLDLLRRAD